MNKEIHTRIIIPSGPEKIWRVLTNFAAYGTWNPFIHAIEGRCEVGSQLRIQLRTPSGGSHVFKPVVVACEPQRSLRWKGALAGLPWLFCGLHSFELHPLSDESTELVHKELFSGLLSTPVLTSIRTDTERGFEAMNHALRSQVESLEFFNHAT